MDSFSIHSSSHCPPIPSVVRFQDEASEETVQESVAFYCIPLEDLGSEYQMETLVYCEIYEFFSERWVMKGLWSSAEPPDWKNSLVEKS